MYVYLCMYILYMCVCEYRYACKCVYVTYLNCICFGWMDYYSYKNMYYYFYAHRINLWLFSFLSFFPFFFNCLWNLKYIIYFTQIFFNLILLNDSFYIINLSLFVFIGDYLQVLLVKYIIREYILPEVYCFVLVKQIFSEW